MEVLNSRDPLPVSLVLAIRAGDVATVQDLLQEHEGLASARIRDGRGGDRTPLHMVADWPGYFPNGPTLVRIFVEAGADPSAPTNEDKPSPCPAAAISWSVPTVVSTPSEMPASTGR